MRKYRKLYIIIVIALRVVLFLFLVLCYGGWGFYVAIYIGRYLEVG